jgi:hypothetical protein
MVALYLWRAARSLLKASLPLKCIFIALFTFLLGGELAGKKCWNPNSMTAAPDSAETEPVPGVCWNRGIQGQ